MRPSFLAKDSSTDYSFFEHFIQHYIANGEELPNFIVHLRPTTPLREIGVINEAINFFLKDEEATCLRSMHKSGTSPYKMFKMKNFFATPVIPGQEIISTNNSRQSFETTYDPNGYIDIIRTNNLSKFKSLHGPKMRIWQTDRVPDIDNEYDLKFANLMIKEKKFETLLQNLLKNGNIS
jgi:CMP-N-acetylneuraminic acid synthetase